jgi:TorA maturation chaperone TorD
MQNVTNGERMTGMDEQTLVAQFRSSVAEDLRVFAILHDREVTEDVLKELIAANFPAGLGLQLKNKDSIEVCDFMRKALADLTFPLEEQQLNDLAADFSAIYLTAALKASPNESVWLTDERLVCQEPMFQLREWYRRYGLAVENWRVRADDHLVFELQFLAHLFKLDHELETLKQAALFLDEHLLRWMKQFAAQVASHCDTAFYAGVSLVTAQYLDELRDVVAGVIGEPRPTPEQIEQRFKPKVEEIPLKFFAEYNPEVDGPPGWS